MEEFKFKKSLGQNFIFDKNLLSAIVQDGGVDKTDIVLEIGAGAGTLTEILCKTAKQVYSFEVDNSLKDRLDTISASNKNLTIIFQDFLKADITTFNPFPTRVVANIPYYITTPIIFKLIEFNFKSILVLIQKEVAQRFCAQPKTKDYGITSVILQSVFDVKIMRIVKKENFTPSPKVDSATIKFTPHNKYKIDNFEQFKNFVHLSFAMRRKTLFNNLKNQFDKDKILSALTNLNKLATIRPEELSVEEFINLYNLLNF